MKNILCYGDSNTWGMIAGSKNIELMLNKRYNYDMRWTGRLNQLLGNKYHVIEAGLCGRNTSFDETKLNRPSRNGLATLPLTLEMSYPLNLVILMLGTNDSIVDFNASPEQTADGLRQMIRLIKSSHFGNEFGNPEVLLISPVPISFVNSADFKLFFDINSIEKTKQLKDYYSNLALQEDCHFLDAADFAKITSIDGVHLDEDSHANLAYAIYNKLQAINF